MIRTSFLATVGVGIALVALGWMLVPTTSILSIAAGLIILAN